MADNEINEFMAITSTDNAELAKQFVEMAGGNLETAISLFFEHGGNALLRNNDTTSNSNPSPIIDDDEDLAQRLQNEAYQQQTESDFVRPPDEARHETLADTHIFPSTYGGVGGSFGPLRHIPSDGDMFDSSRPTGVFNQRLEDYDNNDSDSSSNYSSEDDQEFEYVEEPIVELDDDGEVREYTKLVRRPKALTKEERLALLFRPPFDMMSKTDLDGAKSKAEKRKKWIMVNIQDSGIFQCQALNRDLWSSKDVKRLIKSNFVFLQYQYDSHNAQPYIQFYGLNDKEELPHIAILDPITGERLKQWNCSVPKASEFIKEIEAFLESFSLDPNHANPIVNQPLPKIDPTTLTEEQQMEFAIRQSMNLPTQEEADVDTEIKEVDEESKADINEVELDIFDSIEPVEHEEPANIPGTTTRIQVRIGDGRRIVRRFNVEDTVRTIYEVIKAEVEGFDNCRFTLTDHQRDDLIEKLEITIEDAGLKNSSLILVKDNAEDDE